MALVTGGGRGIGEATCRRLAAGGAAVAVLDLDGGPAEAVAEAIRQDGGAALALTADVARREQAEGAVARAADALGGSTSSSTARGRCGTTSSSA